MKMIFRNTKTSKTHQSYNKQLLVIAFATIFNLVQVKPVLSELLSEVRFDILKAKMYKQFEVEEYQEVLKTIEKIKMLGIPTTDSMLYVQGKALLRTGNIVESKKMFDKYLNRTGRDGEHYKKVIELLLEADDEQEKEARRHKQEERSRKGKELRRKEKENRFKSYDNGIIYDTKYGLEWYAGPDEHIKWENAKAWVEYLSVDGGRWRMPTRKELETVYVEDMGTRNMTPLLKTTSWYVWSCETKGQWAVWYFDFSIGENSWYDHIYSSDVRVFAVRSRKNAKK